MKYYKVIFVCTGNTCRSPMAEALFTSMAKEMPVEADSKGMIVLFPEPVNPKAEVVLNNHNLTMRNHVTAALEEKELRPGTLLLAMTEDHARKLRLKYPNFKSIFTIKEFVGETGDVQDPYGGTLMDYEDCFAELTRLVKKTMYKIEDM